LKKKILIGISLIGIVALLIWGYIAISKSYYTECGGKENMLEKKIFVKGMQLRVEMSYDGQSTLTVTGQYAAQPAKCDERVSKVEYSRLLRKYGMNEPSVLGPAWDWVLIRFHGSCSRSI